MNKPPSYAKATTSPQNWKPVNQADLPATCHPDDHDVAATGKARSQHPSSTPFNLHRIDEWRQAVAAALVPVVLSPTATTTVTAAATSSGQQTAFEAQFALVERAQGVLKGGGVGACGGSVGGAAFGKQVEVVVSVERAMGKLDRGGRGDGGVEGTGGGAFGKQMEVVVSVKRAMGKLDRGGRGDGGVEGTGSGAFGRQIELVEGCMQALEKDGDGEGKGEVEVEGEVERKGMGK